MCWWASAARVSCPDPVILTVTGRAMLVAGAVSREHPLLGRPTEPWDLDMLAGLVLANRMGLVQQDQFCAYRTPKGTGTTWSELG